MVVAVSWLVDMKLDAPKPLGLPNPKPVNPPLLCEVADVLSFFSPVELEGPPNGAVVVPPPVTVSAVLPNAPRFEVCVVEEVGKPKVGVVGVVIELCERPKPKGLFCEATKGEAEVVVGVGELPNNVLEPVTAFVDGWLMF